MNKNGRKTPEERLQMLYAITEEKIKAESLLCEIAPLLDGYFICKTVQSGNQLKISLYNGQTFGLEIKEL